MRRGTGVDGSTSAGSEVRVLRILRVGSKSRGEPSTLRYFAGGYEVRG